MNLKEFEAWKAETAKSKGAWRLDQIHCTFDDTLLYKGGESGIFATIRGRTVEFGRYEGAIPHIGEACFTNVWVHEAGDTQLARWYLARAGGPQIAALLGVQVG
jgi:hypothetical protein